MSIFTATHARTVAIVTAVGLVLGGLFLAQPAMADSAPPDPTNPATPVTVTADVLPTPQIDGVVWAQVVVGNTVYVAGKFTTARPAGSAPGVNTVPRNNLLAYDITTGVLISSFAPNLNAQALGIAASPDGSRVYVVGDFTSIDGAGYYRIAAFNTTTRTIIPSFRPIMESETRAVAASNTTVYTGGDASSVNGVARTYLAAVSASDGSTLGWTANADAPVDALTLTKDGSKLIVGGRFQNLGGVANYGLGAVDATTAAILPWAANQKVRDAGTSSSITALFATSDRIYGSGYVYGSGGNLEGIFSADPDTGNIQWIEDCHGDTYSVFATESLVYGAGHPHYCGNIGGFPQTSPTWTFHHSLAFSKAATGTITGPDPYGYFNWAGNPSPSLQDWFVNWSTGTFTGQGQATWSMAGNDKYLAVGGEFPSVSGVATQGLARFAVPSIAPNKAGPGGIPLVPTAASFKAGQVRVGWAATYDGDNGYLTYKVYRDGGTTPVYQTTQHSNFYTRPAMGFIDSGLAPGITHVYHVKVFDPFGNSTSRDTPSVTVAAQDSGGPYATGVTADGAGVYWPLDEASGSTGIDHIGFTDLQLQSGVTRGAAGPLGGITASTFDGTANGFAVTPSTISPPDTFTTETWIRTTTTTGGKIIGFGSSNTGTSNSYDRHVYMDNAGKIWFGVYPGSVKTVNSAASYNDGQWHQIVASLGSNGMRLYVDGKRVGSRTDVTSGQQYSGYWRVGGDNLSSWTSKPTSNFFKGDIGQVAIYPTVLGPTTIANHYVASGRPSPFPPAPADSYGAAVYNQSPDLYWRLGESSGATATDSGPFQSNGTYAGAVTLGQSGAISGVSNTSVKLTTSKTGSNGKGGTAASVLQYSNPTTYSLELWFSTTTTVGGKLIGFGTSQTGLSSTYDRHIYMQDNGKLVFGTNPGGTRNTITTPNSYNNGQWHHVVATQASDGMMLYVDGALVGTNPQTAAQAYNGYWRIGGDSTWGSTSPYFSGKLDEVAVYSSELSAQAVANHYSLGTAGVIPNQSPVAAFSSSAVDLTASFDGSTSSDSDGTVAGYAWDFGDGTSGTGATTTHAYAAGGSYQVTLTVTDNQGATGAVTKTVTVTAPPPNQPPVAAFTSSAVNLAASFDGSTSSDSDGTVAGYAWDFGDGT
ncbi:MAG: hypothetical protein QOE16_1705, partial [Microbacteriaceae bacterium]|nr:hypothetical protein [Microbacteriaceae bacterium]